MCMCTERTYQMNSMPRATSKDGKRIWEGNMSRAPLFSPCLCRCLVAKPSQKSAFKSDSSQIGQCPKTGLLSDFSAQLGVNDRCSMMLGLVFVFRCRVASPFSSRRFTAASSACSSRDGARDMATRSHTKSFGLGGDAPKNLSRRC